MSVSEWLSVVGGLTVAALVASAVTLASAAQTVDCQQVSTRTEFAICNSGSLLALDREFIDVVNKLRATTGASQREQQQITDRLTKWVKGLDARCRAREACLVRAYRQGIESLQREIAQLERRNATKQEAVKPPGKDEKGRVIAKFINSDRWSYTAGDAKAEVTEYSDGRGFLRVEVIAESGAFKYFAEPHSMLLVTDAKGQIIAEVYTTGLSMRMGTNGVHQKRNSRVALVKPGDFSGATYAFFAFKYCGWRQTFERTVGENNGCHQISLRKEYRAFVAAMPKSLNAVNASVGERFSILGWQGMKIR